MQYLVAISKISENSLLLSKVKHSRSLKSKSMPQQLMAKKLKLNSFMFYDDLQDLLELILKKDILFITGDWNAKVRSQEISGVTGKFGLCVQNGSRTKANRVLSRECTDHSKHPLPTTKEMTLHVGITRWSILKSDSLYYLQPKMEKLYRVSKNKNRN